jgi:hypothetical protein
MIQLVIDNVARRQALEEVEELQRQLSNFNGSPAEMGQFAVEKLGALIPRLLDLMDQHLKDSLNKYTEMLKEQGLLGGGVQVVIRDMEATDEQ